MKQIKSFIVLCVLKNSWPANSWLNTSSWSTQR